MVNQVNYGSTGGIMLGIAEEAQLRGHEVNIFVANSRENKKKKIDYKQNFIGYRFEKNIHRIWGYITGFHGYFSILGTIRLINKIKKFSPDIIHIHNLHGDYINLPIFFNFLKKADFPIVWTLHDCWAFTGRCAHYTIASCDQWKNGCIKCNVKTNYQTSLVDVSSILWKKKSEWYAKINNLTIVIPSRWLDNQLRKSMLKIFNGKVINNGIDLNIFKYRFSTFRENHQIGKDDVMILGVSSIWRYEKGIDIFIRLHECLGDDYKIVLVGVDPENAIPDGIIKIGRTENQIELAKIYSAADVFVNPTREEVLGLVNIEALACGTPVITFNTGGSPECIDEKSGIIVEVDDMTHMIEMITKKAFKSFSRDRCFERARAFNRESKFKDYVDLYEELEI